MADITEFNHLVDVGGYDEHPDATPDRTKSFLFSVGNSSDGPVGYCMRVEAKTSADAVAVFKEALPESEDLQPHAPNAPGEVEYLSVYFNDAPVSLLDVEEWCYLEDR